MCLPGGDRRPEGTGVCTLSEEGTMFYAGGLCGELRRVVSRLEKAAQNDFDVWKLKDYRQETRFDLLNL